jgi:hypothetical protein
MWFDIFFRGGENLDLILLDSTPFRLVGWYQFLAENNLDWEETTNTNLFNGYHDLTSSGLFIVIRSYTIRRCCDLNGW